MQTDKQTKYKAKITGFSYYKGHVIDVESCGHQQAQNILIDGKNVGYVTFPTPAISTARMIIDAREICDCEPCEQERESKRDWRIQ